MMESKEKQQNPTSNELLAILDQLSFDQKRFIIARQNTDTDKGAAKAIGIRPRAVYEWRHRGVPLDRALSLIVLDGLTVALHLRRAALARAMAVKVAGLDSENERARQSSATEIIEWEMGRAAQPLTGKDGGPIRVIGGVDLDEL